MKVLLLLLLMIGVVFGGPWLDQLLDMQLSIDNPPKPSNYRSYGQRRGKGGKERWKEICRVINPDSYAFPARAPACPW